MSRGEEKKKKISHESSSLASMFQECIEDKRNAEEYTKTDPFLSETRVSPLSGVLGNALRTNPTSKEQGEEQNRRTEQLDPSLGYQELTRKR